MIAKPRFAVSLEDQDGQLDFLRDQQPLDEGLCCPCCEPTGRLLVVLVDQQQLRRESRWLRRGFWGMALAFVVSIVVAYFAFPHSSAWLFIISAFWFALIAGERSGRLAVARAMEEREGA